MVGQASRVALGKKSSAEHASKTEPSPPKPFFPYARYTSLVGVHCSLLAFTALFLPRSGFADLSSPAAAARNRRDAMTMLTESPGRTVSWMCLGAFVLQWWWASWLREWELEASVNMQPLPPASEDKNDDNPERTKRKLRQLEWNSQKPTVLMKATAATLVASLGFHVICVLFGAPFVDLPLRTYSLSLLVSLLTVWTPAYVLGLPVWWKPDSQTLVRRFTWVRLFAELKPGAPIERALVYPAVGAILGCWTGVIPIGLDWDRPWQAYPLTPAWGALGGYILGSMWALLVNDLQEIIDVGLKAEREDDNARGRTSKKKKVKKPTS